MAACQLGESSNQGMNINSHDTSEEENFGSKWYFSRKEIEENSPSRRDGIDLKKETYLRKSYCTFLQDLGMRLKVPQVTIATAIVFCHRFFLRQSHAKNDRRTIATVCMFLAGKVEETPRPLKDVILVSYEIIHKKDPSAVQKIKQKDVYEQQKELILLGERLVLATLGFDFNVHHPYKPLVEAIKRFKVAQNALAQVAWNFVNDGLRTSLFLQYKPHHIAAGAIFLAAKFLKVKLPSEGEMVWWQEFDVTPRQLEDVSNQMLELYEQNKTTQSSHTAGEAEGNMGSGSNRPAVATSIVSENSLSVSGPAQNARANKQGGQAISCELQPHGDNRSIQLDSAQKLSVGSGTPDDRSGVWDQSMDSDTKDCVPNEVENISDVRQNALETSIDSKSTIEQHSRDAVVKERSKLSEIKESKDEASLNKPFTSGSQMNYTEVGKRLLPSDVIVKIDKDKVKAALQKRRKFGNDVAKDMHIIDDDDLMERELEDGIESSIDNEKVKQPRVHEWSKHQNTHEPSVQKFDQDKKEDMKNIKVDQQLSKPKTRSKLADPEFSISSNNELENVEEGELSSLDDQDVPSAEVHSTGMDTSTMGSSLKVCATGGAGLKRNRSDYDSHSKIVGESAIGIGRKLENM